MNWINAAPGAVFFAAPEPKNEYASNNPRPGPGLASSKNRTDLPASFTWSRPSGLKIPWLIALFKNKIFAGSMNKLASGNKCALTIAPTPAAMMSSRPVMSGPNTLNPPSINKPPMIPTEKLLTSISRPGLTFPSIK